MPQDLVPGARFKANEGVRTTCPRCSTMSLFNVVAVPNQPNVPQGHSTFGVLRCQACGGHVAFEGEAGAPQSSEFTFRRLHPVAEPPDLEHAPESVAAAIREAALCLSVDAPTAGALAMRRAVQLIARDKDVPKGSLQSEIDALPISDDLREYAHSVRIIANEAAHPDPFEWDQVTGDDLKELLDLGREFVNQIYAVPARVNALRERAAEIDQT